MNTTIKRTAVKVHTLVITKSSFLFLCFFIFAFNKNCVAQTDFVTKAYTLLQLGDYNSARSYIDSSMNDSRYINDGQAWYLQGFIYKTIYNKNEKGNKESPSRIIALQSFKKSIELDTSQDAVAENKKNIVFLTKTLYNDVVSNLDTFNYNIAVRDFEKFKEYDVLIEPNIVQKDIEFKNALVTVYSALYETHSHNLKYYDLAIQQLDEILAMDNHNYKATWNKLTMEANNKLNKKQEEQQKLKQELELKSSRISLLDKENEVKKMTLNEKQFEIDKQKLEADKKSKELSMLNMDNEILNKNKQLDEKEIKQQKQMRNVFIGGLLVMFIFVGFVFRSLRIRNRQNRIIVAQKDVVERQKQIVEQKNQEITDSIEYALRIQTAILPPQRIIKQYLENSFILYKPKDIVAGDFYWMETINDLVLFAACDCTGHGVPGAMVSVVCHNALNRAVREFGLTQPAAILDKTAEIVIENFSKSEEDIKDGMDISLCAYNTKTKTLEWAGANNPLWLIQNGELIETKADKQPIGMNEDSKPFTNHTFTLNKGDSIYLFTDGFADQFGGDTGEKKLTRKRFKELLITIQSKSMQEQGIKLDKFITEYRKEVEQIDDIIVMGVRV